MENVNKIVYFEANYYDNNGKKVKPRSHLLLEIEGDNLLFLKLSGKRTKLGGKSIEVSGCLDKPAYPYYKHKVIFSLTDLKKIKCQYFYVWRDMNFRKIIISLIFSWFL